MQKQDCILIGRTIKPHGIHGELIIETSNPEVFEDIKESVFLDIEGLLVPFFIEQTTQSSPQRFRMKFLWIDSEEQTFELINSEIYTPTKNIKTEQIIVDSPDLLIDFTVIDKNHGTIGRIDQFIDNPSNPILLITKDRTEILIPYHKDIITRIRTKMKELHIDAPEGLIDLYLNPEEEF